MAGVSRGGRAKTPKSRVTATKAVPVRFNSSQSSDDGDGKTVEQIYQKKTQLEHILLRPDTYIGSTTLDTQDIWIYDDASSNIVRKNVSFSPGLYKIFDEILVNAADNKERDPKMKMIQIEVNAGKNLISVWNDGKGVPVTIHKDEHMYVPTMIFGHLLTSSNYNDSEKKVTGGRNGFGAKLCNIFSKSFTVETASNEYKKKFTQVWHKNMTDTNGPEISEFKGSDFTRISFNPDLERFGMTCIDEDFISLVKRRAYDVNSAVKGIQVKFNGDILPKLDFKSYAELYIKGLEKELSNSDEIKDDTKIPLVYERSSDRWEVCVAPIDSGPHHMSFVNSIATTKGGTHVSYVYDKIIAHLMPIISRKITEKRLLKPVFIRNNLFVFVNCKIENPCFDSQTKENLVLSAKKFGSTWEPTNAFLKNVSKVCVDSITDFINMRNTKTLMKQAKTSKRANVTGISKLDDANKAGGPGSLKCSLILTEGDSAKSLAVAGLSVIGRDYYGVFPLRGKLLNVRSTALSVALKNIEIANIIKILGLDMKVKYDQPHHFKTLRYGSIIIMADQDEDGSHIKGLLINFIHTFWPHLIQKDFLKSFITPLLKVFNKKESREFFSFSEYREWKNSTLYADQWRVKYYKGLGTSTSKEAKEYFGNMKRHCISFCYSGTPCDSSIKMAFCKESADARKNWIETFLEEAKTRRQIGLPDVYLYKANTTKISYNDFINKELVLFSCTDNRRAIPSMVDGLKPSQRKVLFTMLKKYEKKEVKVAQLSGAVSELTAYHHGEASLASTIVTLAQDFVGSNNINLLLPIGQFGSRLNGGKDAASARYIFTALNPLTRYIFSPLDDPILNYIVEDNQIVEPDWYCPIIPIILVNGTDGIGTGYSTKVANYNYREIIEMLQKMIQNDSDPYNLQPWYKNFTGRIEETEVNHFVSFGQAYRMDDDRLEIAELPIKTWTQTYKEDTLVPMLQVNSGETSSNSNFKIQAIKEYHSDTKVRFILKFNNDQLQNYGDEDICRYLKLESKISTTNMCLFDEFGVLKKYESVKDIVRGFYDVRLRMYENRKKYLVDKLHATCKKLANQARFILEIIDEKLVLSRKKKAEIIDILVSTNYDGDPVKAWHKRITSGVVSQINLANDSIMPENSEDEDKEEDMDYEYLYSLSLLHLTNEKRDHLLAEKDRNLKELEDLRKLTPKDLWINDLQTLLTKIDELENKEDKESAASKLKQKKVVQPDISERIEQVEIKSYAPKVKSTQSTKPKVVRKRKLNDLESNEQEMETKKDEEFNEVPVERPKRITKRAAILEEPEEDDDKEDPLVTSYYDDEDYM